MATDFKRFNDLIARQLFGSEDAESENPERFKQYFIQNGAYEDLRAPLPLRIVTGHKGVGKSALLRRSYLDDVDNNILAVEIQPNDISGLMANTTGESFLEKIERWKNGINRIVADKAVSKILEGSFDVIRNETLSTIGRNVTSAVRRILTSLKSDIANTANLAIAENFLNNGIIRVYIDDVDRGWSASPNDISNISALINAVRDLCNSEHNFQCRIALRTDVYFLVRTSDESTDKIEQDIIRLQWTNDEILRMISRRIMTYFSIPEYNEFSSLSQARISKEILSKVMDPEFVGQGLWSRVPVSIPLMSLCRKRPRDLVKLLHGAAGIAGNAGRSVISSDDLEKSFESYSDERLQDLVNEFKSELPEIQSLLLKFKPSRVEKKASINYRYTTDQIISKLSNIRQQVPLQFTSRRPMSERALVSFLYKIDFIIARKDVDGAKTQWIYFDQRRFLANDAIDFGFQWEIHPAYRWAIQPNDIQSVISNLIDIS